MEYPPLNTYEPLSDDFFGDLKKLIDTGRFQKFVTHVDSVKGKESMLFNNSSFQCLEIFLHDHSNDVNTIRSIMSYLEINTCVTELLVYLPGVCVYRINDAIHETIDAMDAIDRVVKYNTTLKHLKIVSIPFPEVIDGVRQIANTLQNNTTLSNVKLNLEGMYINHNNLHSYMARIYPDLTQDPRLSYI